MNHHLSDTTHQKPMKIVVGLSGGVDSAVTAKLLVDQGHEVIGVFMKNWDDKDDAHCPAAIDAIDARQVADQLGIPFYSLNFAKEYWGSVFEYFLQEHRKFRTPNPDILCNKFIKFAAFLDAAEELGAEKIATGHYARNFYNEVSGLYELQTPKDANKDQTYFLHALNQDQLSKALFPLADLTKPEIRQIAKDNDFVNAEKKDSTGICFVGERDYMTFLKKYLHQTPGDIITEQGDIIGQHIGLSFYTLGQRKNLNIGGVKGYEEAPWFVLAKDIDQNQLLVCQDSDNPKLFSDALTVSDINWIAGSSPLDKEGQGGISLLAKIRYRQESQACTITETKPGITRVTFDASQRAITPGQSIVFYSLDGKVCLGGGEINDASRGTSD